MRNACRYKTLAARAHWDPMADLIGDQYMEDGIKKESTPDRSVAIN